MKIEEFKTSKGEFVLVDLPVDSGFSQDKVVTAFIDSQNWIASLLNRDNTYKKLEYINLMKDITEQQASEIVDLFTEYSKMYQDYERPPCGYDTAIESLHSLIKSKGIYLYENPKDTFGVLCILVDGWIEAEQKTFYNPYIFKRI